MKQRKAKQCAITSDGRRCARARGHADWCKFVGVNAVLDDASLKRLKSRIRRKVLNRGRFLVDFGLDHINECIDAWRKAEAKRGGR